jgi:hypothetical protein
MKMIPAGDRQFSSAQWNYARRRHFARQAIALCVSVMEEMWRSCGKFQGALVA